MTFSPQVSRSSLLTDISRPPRGPSYTSNGGPQGPTHPPNGGLNAEKENQPDEPGGTQIKFKYKFFIALWII